MNGGLDPWESDDGWTDFRDASYCTLVPATLSPDRLRDLAGMILEEVFERAKEGHPIKRICERLSWMDADGLKEGPERRLGGGRF